MSYPSGNRRVLLCAILLALCLLIRSSAASAKQPVPADFDGDGKTDISVIHLGSGTPGQMYWKYLTSCGDTSEDSIAWGLSTDIPVPGNYQGINPATEPAIARPTSSGLEWWNYELGTVDAYFGQNTDIPVPRDYTGDGQIDIAVVRPGTAPVVWYIHDKVTGFFTRYWGLDTDKLVPEDYNGDGNADPAVFRPSGPLWYIQDWKPPHSWWTASFGLGTDLLVPGDYDGDLDADQAVYRPSDGYWYILKSSTNTMTSIPWGLSTDIPVPGDYDGDGNFDVAVFRPSSATWYILYSGGGNCIRQFGNSADTPIPALYTPYYQ